MRRFRMPILLAFAFFALAARADGIRDNNPDTVRPVPPPGIEVPAADRAELEAGIAALGKNIESLKTDLLGRTPLLELLPDVQIFYNAARYALTYNEFFSPGEIGVAKSLLKAGMERADALRNGNAPWTTQTGPVVRGYVSRIDDSVQPYGLIVPASFHPDSGLKYRLDFWFHGRGETLSELNFLNDRRRNFGEFNPSNTFVLHLYGRYCCANKLAGEIDAFEALENVKKHYAIDDDRISVRGFSMGGAACWQFAVHYAGDWVAAAPGAGFAETADFLKVFQSETLKPTWYEQKLWHVYDCTDYAVNLFNCPTVAYSGEKDSQKQAADIMAKALEKEGMTLEHIIGEKAGHFYTAAGRAEVAARIDAIAAKGRNPIPRVVRFTTWTLRYNKMLWLTLDGMGKHWERARVDAEITDANTVVAKTQNATELTFSMPSGLCPLDMTRRPKVVLDGQKLEAPPVLSDRSWVAHFRKSGSKWAVVPTDDDGTLRKRHGLQGPIDDAFLDSFVMVMPTGQPLNPKVGEWVKSESARAVIEWRKQFRGEAPVKKDADITEEDIAKRNLILWGDPSGNKILAKIIERLPIKWDATAVHVGPQSYPADRHAAILIYPNPLNPKRYVVLNSGFTYREYDYLNNARQIPKLPDYAIIDLSIKPNTRTPGGIADAGFFGETWELLPNGGKP